MNGTRGQTGFTILELMIASAILAFVLLGVCSLFVSNNTTYTLGQDKIEVQQNARVAMQTLARELRMAGYDPPGDIALQATPTAVQLATVDTVSFLADMDDDGVLDQVTYRLQGTQVLREFSSWNGTIFPAAVPSVLADGVSALTLTYFDDNTPTNNQIAAPVAAGNLPDIRRVTIDVLTTDTTAAGTQQNFPLTADVQLRNLG